MPRNLVTPHGIITPVKYCEFTIAPNEKVAVTWDVHEPRAILFGVLSGCTTVVPRAFLVNGRELLNAPVVMSDGAWFLGVPTMMVSKGDTVCVHIQSASRKVVHGDVEFMYSSGDADRWLQLVKGLAKDKVAV